MNDALTELTELAKTGILKATAIASEQFPELISQILRWELTVSSVGIGFGITLLIITRLFFSKKAQEWIEKNYEFVIVPFLTGVAGLTILIINTFKFLNIIIAPKLYLLSYLKGLIN